jgi:hypothetical protein
MKAITVLALSLLLSACSLTPRQKMVVVGAILVTGAIAAAELTEPRYVRMPKFCADARACY